MNGDYIALFNICVNVNTFTRGKQTAFNFKEEV